MSIIWLKRKGPFLFAYDQGGMERFDRLPVDKPLRAEITQPRNAGRLRLYHALVDVVAKGVGVDHDSMDDDLRMNLGYFVEVKLPGGRTYRRPTSISFDAMPDEAAFNVFVEKAIAAIYMLYGILPADARAQLDEMLAPRTEKRR